MTIRGYVDSDYQEIKALAEKYNINLPIEGKVIVAVDDNNKVVSFMIMRGIMMIEPFIGENSLANKHLFDKFEWLMNISDVKIVRCNIEKKNIKLLEKLGFYRVFEKHVQMEKNYERNIG